ncbi:MAG: phospho-N-acetylmuramoyl-pentapeptide-transferase [Candidatus Omnitrophota bacterium]
MLYYILYSLRDTFFGFNVFRYITFRSACALVSSFLISVLIGPFVIKKLTQLKIGQHIRTHEAPSLYELHKTKQGTPTMGGIIILIAVLVATLLWGDIRNKYVILSMSSMLWLGLVGAMDDIVKLKRKNAKGLTKIAKLLSQVSLGIIVGIIIFNDPAISHNLDIPFFKKLVIDLGIFYIPFVVIVLVGTSNAVNLTDGLDGLAIGCTTMAAFTYFGLAYVTGHAKFSGYLNIVFTPGAGELSVFCASLVGAGLGFLWFNAYPASVFMGDTGSLALGGAIGIVSILIKKELILIIVGGIFVMEALSVIIQVTSFRSRKKRVFLMAPIHHHFQLKGWAEPKVIVRFWIIAALLALMSLSTLKLR